MPSSPASPTATDRWRDGTDRFAVLELALAVIVPAFVVAEFRDLIDVSNWIYVGPVTLEWVTVASLALAIVVLAGAARALWTRGLAVLPVLKGLLAALTGFVAVSGLAQLNAGRGGVYFAGLFAGVLAVALGAVVLLEAGVALVRSTGSR